MTHHFDTYGDPRDIELEARQIVSGTLPLRPTTAHCLAVLKDVLNKEETLCDSVKRFD